MLIQFNCKNFKSYRDEFSLDMSATSIKEHNSNLILDKNDEKFLRTAAIYGANSSGKSNTIEAFDHMKFLVLTSFTDASKRKHIPLKRFAFDSKSKAANSDFEVFFTFKNMYYQYGFSLNSDEIVEEWLYKRDFRGKDKYNLIFERNNKKFELSSKLSQYREILNGLNSQTLLLSFLSNIKFEDLNNAYNWFLETEVISFGDPIQDVMNSRCLPEECINNSSEFRSFLESIDVGIESIHIEKNPDSDEENPTYKAFSIHQSNDTKKPEMLKLSDESKGTLKMISLYEPIKTALEKGATIFIDEMDAKLHPLLTKYLVQMFHSEETNRKKAQLIFTTHDVVNLTKDIFRRDQIWFVEKDKENVSNLFSLVEYKIDHKKIRNDASYNKDYLHGRYGALPILKKFEVRGE